MFNFTDRPLAAEGLISYRYKGRYGWIMIGACDDDDALREAERLMMMGENATLERLERHDGASYQPVVK